MQGVESQNQEISLHVSAVFLNLLPDCVTIQVNVSMVYWRHRVITSKPKPKHVSRDHACTSGDTKVEELFMNGIRSCMVAEIREPGLV